MGRKSTVSQQENENRAALEGNIKSKYGKGANPIMEKRNSEFLNIVTAQMCYKSCVKEKCKYLIFLSLRT